MPTPKHPMLRSVIRAALPALVAALTFLPAVVQAAVYYVSPSGNDVSSGLSLSAAWKTIGKANNALRAGDVVFIQPGTYSNSIAPVSSGTSTNRIRYIGVPGNPTQVSVTNITITTDYVTVQGVSGGFSSISWPARFDSVAFCALGGFTYGAAKYSMVAHNAINGHVYFAANAGLACFDHGVLDPACKAACEFDTLRGNAIDLGTIQGGDRAFTFHGFVQTSLVDSNRVTAFMTGGGAYPTDAGTMFVSYNSYNNTFRHNHWSVEADQEHPNNNWHAITFRDSSSNYTFDGDTVIAGAQSGYEMHVMLTNSGNWPGTVKNNTWKNCVMMFGEGGLLSQDILQGDWFENNVIVSNNGRALYVPGKAGNNTWRHNTFYSGSQALYFEGSLIGPNEFTSNVVYSRAATAAAQTGAQSMFMAGTTGWSGDYNVFFSPTYTSVTGDRSLGLCCYSSSRPGSGQGWNQKTGQDANSRYGSPRFTDSTFATFNAKPLSGSAVIGAGVGGSDAGAIPFGVDAIAPSAIATLDTTNVYDRTLNLKWLAPGDNGNAGQATAYDLRWSSSAITSSNFSSATPMSPQPIPLNAGSLQNYVVQNLTPGATYYFAIKAVDATGNWSGISNVVRVTTASSDHVSPASIQDLGAY